MSDRECRLTECKGKPRCEHCLAMDARYGGVPLPEPAASSYTMDALVPGGHQVTHISPHRALPSGTKLVTIDQASAYAQQCVEAERERCALVAENYPRADGWIAEEIAAAIRKGN